MATARWKYGLTATSCAHPVAPAVELGCEELLRVTQQLREQSVRRYAVAPISNPLLGQRLGQREGHLLYPDALSPFVQREQRRLARTVGQERSVDRAQSLYQRCCPAPASGRAPASALDPSGS